MAYFKLESSVDRNEIGAYPQLKLSHASYQDGERSFAHIEVPLEGRIEGDMLIPRFLLEKQANLLDFMQITPKSSDYFALSNSAYDFLQRFEIDECQTYKAEAERDGSLSPFHLVHFVWHRNREYIDWAKSTFVHTTQFGAEIIKELQFPDYESFYAYKKPLVKLKQSLYVRQLFLNEMMIDKDVFRLLFVSSGIFVSQRLKDAMQYAGLIGVRFRALDDLGLLTSAEQKQHMAASSKP